MLIESISIMHIGIAFLFAVLFFVAVHVMIYKTTNLLNGKEQDAINQARSELDALKVEVNALKTKLEVTRSDKMDDASLVPVLPTTSQVVLENTCSQCNDENQSTQKDTWTRAALVSDRSISAISQTTSGDTWAREPVNTESVGELNSVSRLTGTLSSGHAKSKLVDMKTISQRASRARKRSLPATSTHASHKGDLTCQSPTASD